MFQEVICICLIISSHSNLGEQSVISKTQKRLSFIYSKDNLLHYSFFISSTIVSTSSRDNFSLPDSIAFSVFFANANGILQNKDILRLLTSFIYSSAKARF